MDKDLKDEAKPLWYCNVVLFFILCTLGSWIMMDMMEREAFDSIGDDGICWWYDWWWTCFVKIIMLSWRANWFNRERQTQWISCKWWKNVYFVLHFYYKFTLDRLRWCTLLLVITIINLLEVLLLLKCNDTQIWCNVVVDIGCDCNLLCSCMCYYIELEGSLVASTHIEMFYFVDIGYDCNLLYFCMCYYFDDYDDVVEKLIDNMQLHWRGAWLLLSKGSLFASDPD